MLFVAGENLVPILVALLIGFVTGLWIWKFARKVVVRPDPTASEDAPMRRPYVDRSPSPAPPNLDDHAADTDARPRPRPEPEVLARRAIAAGEARAGAAERTSAALGVGAPASERENVVADDLQVMKGVGPRLATLLQTEGITRYDQIAALTPGDLTRLDAHLGAFKGRLVRDRIVEQAAFLAAGDRVGYEREFGRL